ncbi:MAG: siderophore-interacting protein, partial [Mesorhizobium sp.]
MSVSEASASGLACEARLNLRNLPLYIDRISDRLQSFDADASQEGQRLDFRFAFGGGTTQDPAGKEGLANLMSGL